MAHTIFIDYNPAINNLVIKRPGQHSNDPPLDAYGYSDAGTDTDIHWMVMPTAGVYINAITMKNDDRGRNIFPTPPTHPGLQKKHWTGTVNYHSPTETYAVYIYSIQWAFDSNPMQFRTFDPILAIKPSAGLIGRIFKVFLVPMVGLASFVFGIVAFVQMRTAAKKRFQAEKEKQNLQNTNNELKAENERLKKGTNGN